MKIKNYYHLAKPGIIYGNAITAAAGFFVASRGNINLRLLLAALFGLSFIIGSACVFNNIMDRKIDSMMQRTKDRALAAGVISVKNALIYGIVLGIIGAFILWRFTNVLTLLIALAGELIYIFLYGFSKRHSIHGTIVGSLAGAVPPVIGYCAVTNRFDAGAIILFLILVLWQMPHFYAIAIYRQDDYAAASIPVLPIKQGSKFTKISMLVYIVGFVIAALMLSKFGYTGKIYLIIAALLGLYWLWLGIKGFASNVDEKRWARKMFFTSLIILTVLSVAMSVDAVRLPK